MPNIGKETVSASSRQVNAVARGRSITMIESGTLNSITAYLSDSATGDSFGAAIYDSAGNLIASSAVRTNISTAGWYTFTGFGAVNLASGSSYYIVAGSGDSAAAATISNEETGGTGFGVTISGTISWPATHDFPANQDARDYSIYATYTSSAVAGPTDFKVQYVSGTLTGSGATLTAPANFQAVGALSKAFILPATTMPTAGFGTDADESQMRHFAVTANMTAVDTIALLRGANAASNASYAFWIIEYIGAVDGANEFVMRGKDVQTFGVAATTADSAAISGIVSLSKCVPFINGRHTDTATASLRDFLAEARVYNNGTNNVIGLTRELAANGEPTYVCYCVEFTGSNWKIQSGLATNYAADTNKDTTITTVEALSKAWVFGYVNASDAGTPAAATWYAWLSSTTNLRSRTPVAGAGTDFRWFVIENSDARFSVETVNAVDGAADWTAGASPQTQSVSIASTRSAGVFVTGRAGSSEAVTTSNPASCWRIRQASQTSVEAHRTRSLGSSEYVIQAVQLPIDTLPAVLRLPRTNPLVRM